MALLQLAGELFQLGLGTKGVVVVVDRAHLLRHGLGEGLRELRLDISDSDEEVLDDGRVLGVTLCDRERVLPAGYVDPHRDDTNVIAEVHAVDHERHEVELALASTC
jgi:hypothetical protein